MTREEAVNWIINITADIGKAEHRDLWHYEQALSEIREMLEEQPEQRWIPCSERLPKESGRYLISALDGIQTRTTVAPYQPRCKAWTMTGRMTYWKVIAWMPLPEPYGGEQE